MSDKTKGFIQAMISSCTFGMIPLFSLPCLNAGMDTLTVVAHRYGLASIAMLVIMAFTHQNFKITVREAVSVFVLALFNNLGAYTLIYGYQFMDTGAATTLQFSYPVFTCIIMVVCFNEKLTSRTAIAILLAVLGVACLSGYTPGEGRTTLLGVGIELLAGFVYAVYLVLVPILKVRSMNSSKLTFFVFLFSTFQLLAVSPLAGGIEITTEPSLLVSLLLLGIIPTAVSNYTLILGLKKIGSTTTAILGALEPLTAMIIGIFVFGEKMTTLIALGFVAIVTSVIILILHRPNKNKRHVKRL